MMCCSVTPEQVLVTATLSADVDVMSAIFPGFLFDGARNTSVFVNETSNVVCVELPGDATSALGTTSVLFAVLTPPAPAVLSWYIPSYGITHHSLLPS